eukprot:scaffold269_cov404-Prasinococcus_capsulatus_cf.AAC.12
MAVLARAKPKLDQGTASHCRIRKWPVHQKMARSRCYIASSMLTNTTSTGSITMPSGTMLRKVPSHWRDPRYLAGTGISLRLGHTLCARNKVDALVKLNLSSWDILGMQSTPEESEGPLQGDVQYRNRHNQAVAIDQLVHKYADDYNTSAARAADLIVHLSAAVRGTPSRDLRVPSADRRPLATCVGAGARPDRASCQQSWVR